MASRAKADEVAKEKIKVEKSDFVRVKNRFGRVVMVSFYKAKAMLRANELDSKDSEIYHKDPSKKEVK